MRGILHVNWQLAHSINFSETKNPPKFGPNNFPSGGQFSPIFQPFTMASQFASAIVVALPNAPSGVVALQPTTSSRVGYSLCQHLMCFSEFLPSNDSVSEQLKPKRKRTTACRSASCLASNACWDFHPKLGGTLSTDVKRLCFKLFTAFLFDDQTALFLFPHVDAAFLHPMLLSLLHLKPPRSSQHFNDFNVRIISVGIKAKSDVGTFVWLPSLPWPSCAILGHQN